MIHIKWRTIIVTTILLFILGTFMLAKFSNKAFGNNENDKNDISEEQIISWIKAQGKQERYYFAGFSYELANLDNDSELEVVAKTVGGVHLGNFFIFDKKQDEGYHLITEQDWKIESWNLSEPIAAPIEVGKKKIFELVTRTGGTGFDTYEVRLWYIEDEKFIQAWYGILYDRLPVSGGGYYLKIGNYQFNQSDNQIYSWLSKYRYSSYGGEPIQNYGTNTMIHRFDGVQFVLKTETGFIK